MVDKILRLAELERYDFEQIPQHLQLDEVVADVCKRMQGKAIKFNLKLKLNVHKAVVFADRESLFHIFMNLIDNAIKYNEAGGEIVVTSHQDNEHVAIDVANTGAGIPMDAREKLFQPFFTVNKDRSRISGGTGLGLALVKKLTEKQQGYVELRRSDTEWTLFRVTFPRKLNEESK
ncbi:sensor histidine kinase [Priestia flexa]